MKLMKLTLIKRSPETHDSESFFWQPEEKFDYKPGQFLKWTLRDNHPDDRGNQRFFTISSSPSEDLLRLTTKFNADRSSSFKTTLQLLSPGETLEAFGPLGAFVLPEDVTAPVVLVAGGIGITPFRSMLRHMADTNRATPTQLIYACRSLQDIAFQEELAAIAKSLPNIVVIPVIASADSTWTGQTGALDGPRINELAGGLDSKTVYLSGPEPMIKAFGEQLQTLVSEDQIKTDFFPGYTEF